MILTDISLLELNSQGIIPGPNETEEAFCKRAEYCLSLREQIGEKLKGELPFIENERPSDEFLQPALSETNQLFGSSPAWVPLFFSNYRLAPWHGGCAWIFQQSEETPTSAFLQLRRAFASSETYLGLYSRKELIAHELCHVGRMCFEEPRFEEILAYRTSPSLFRRWLGAIAQSSWETTAFFLILCLILAVDFFAVPMLWLKLLPLILVLAALFRLTKRQSEFSSCLARLEELLHDKSRALALIYRLTDREIVSFSKMAPDAIKATLEEKKGSTLRWRLIERAYL